MEQDILYPKTIEKEEISNLYFPKDEVLNDPQVISGRNAELHKAMVLGNNHKVKYSITFEDDEGLKEVRTTVWAATEYYVSLKEGVMIPVKRIHQIKTC